MEGPKHDNQDGHLRYMLCQDGSDASYQALHTLENGYMKREEDHLAIAHVWVKEQ